MSRSAGVPGLTAQDLERLLGRPLVDVDIQQQRQAVAGRTVLVTGAGGSVGQHLIRGVAAAGAKRIVMLDSSERALFWIDETVRQLVGTNTPDLTYRSVLGSVCDPPFVEDLLTEERPDLLLHAAAYKHVDMVERNPLEGIRTNVAGTWHLLRAARSAGVGRILLISTDKAVRPCSLMGATKRAAELVVRANADPQHLYASVRFGNVLGSSGSVLQVFASRLRDRQPLEIRHPDATRYFLAGREAAGLLTLAAGLAEAGDLLVLKTGPQRRIRDLATDLIHILGAELAAGAVPSPPTRVTALRPGERIDERLSDGEPQVTTGHPSIVRLREVARDPDEIRSLTEALTAACDNRKVTSAVKVLGRLVPEYRPS